MLVSFYRFTILFLLLNCSFLTAQAVYPLYGPCSENSFGSSDELLAVSGDRLLHQTYDFRSRDYTVMLTSPDGNNDTLFVDRFKLQLIEKSDTLITYTRSSALFRLRPTDARPEVFYRGQGAISDYTTWNGDIYVIEGSDRSGRNLVVRYEPATETRTELLISGFRGWNGIGTLDSAVVFYGHAENVQALYRTEGTPESTVRIDSLYPYDQGLTNPYTSFPTQIGDRLVFFYGTNGGDENALWSTDGTTGGALKLTRLDRDPFGSAPRPVVLNDVFYFSARTSGSPSGTTYQLWRSDGTVAGTENLNRASGNYLSPSSLDVYNDYVYITGRQGFRRTNATVDGTEPGFPGMRPGGGLTGVAQLITFRDSLFLSASIPFDDFEPWMTDGTYAGSRKIADLAPGSDESSAPRELQAGADVVYFTGLYLPGRTSRRLYVYDARRGANGPISLTLDSVATVDQTTAGLGTIQLFATGDSLRYAIGSDTNSTGTFTELSPGDYTFTITDLYGCSLTDSTTIALNTATYAPPAQEDYRVQPNPVRAGGTFALHRLAATTIAAASVEIVDLTGRTISRRTAGNTLVQAPGQAGTYLVVARDKGLRVIGRWKLAVY